MERDPKLLLCIANDGYEASLERRKFYVRVPDATAARHRQVRIIDESGEDYLYPAAWFVPVRLPAEVQRAVLLAG